MIMIPRMNKIYPNKSLKMSMLGCPRRTDSALDRGIFAAYQGSTFDGWLDPTTQVTLGYPVFKSWSLVLPTIVMPSMNKIVEHHIIDDFRPDDGEVVQRDQDTVGEGVNKPPCDKECSPTGCG